MKTERAALLVVALVSALVAIIALSPVESIPIEREAVGSNDAPHRDSAVERRSARPVTASRAALPTAPNTRAIPSARRLVVERLGDRGRLVVGGELVFVFGATPRDEARARLADAGLTLLDYTPSIGAARVALPAGWSVADGLAYAQQTPTLPEAAPNALAWAADGEPLHALDNAALDALLASRGGGVDVYGADDDDDSDEDGDEDWDEGSDEDDDWDEGGDERPRAHSGPHTGGSAGGPIDPWAPPTAAEISAAQKAVSSESSFLARAYRALVDYTHRSDPIVAVVDSGVLHKSAVLSWGAFIRNAPYDRVATVAGYDFVRDHALALDKNRHGTHVASTIVRTSGNRARIMPIKVLDRLSMGTEYDVARGMLHAIDNGAHIINLSLTFGLYYVPSPLFAEVLDRCQHGDVLVIAAAGNDGASTVTYPAALRGVIAVGADRPDAATFANRGAALDLVAPAGASPAAQGGVSSETFQLYRPAQPAAVRLVGTSMAAAAATGAIAQIMHDLERDGLLPDGPPGTRVDFVRHVVTHSAAPLGAVRFEPAWGMGTVDDDAALALAERLIADDLVASTAGERIGVAAQTSVFIEQTGAEQNTAVRGVALVEALDPDGYPLVGATLHGDWEGTARGPASCTTDTWGRCVMTTSAVALPAGERLGVLMGLNLHRALSAGAAYDVRPAERYHGPRAATLGHTSQALEFVTPADALDADDLALLDEIDPLTGGPQYCLGDTCPGYTPDLGDPDDLFRISNRRIYLATRFAGGTPPAESLLAGRALVPSYQYRRHGRALQGGGLVLAFDDAFADDAVTTLGDDLHLVPDGLRLGSAGPGEPLLWVNDLTPAVLVEGTGMMPSGVSIIGFDLRLWSVQLFYAFDVGGAGMMPSGVSITFTSRIDYFNYNLALIGQSFATFGSALLDATHSPFALLAIDHLEP